MLRNNLPQDLLDLATQVNFNEMHKDIATNVTNDFFVKEKEAMVKSNTSDEFLVPSLELIKTSMEEVFNNPR